MNLLNKLKGIATAMLIVGFSAAGTVATAQQATPPAQQGVKHNFSDADLKQFADASTRLMTIQQEGEKAMLGILQEEKLGIEKFNQMAQAHQQQKLAEVDATAEEKAAFNKAAQRMMEMQPAMQKEVETAIQKDGMSLEKYEQIMMAYRQDPALQQRVNQMMGQQ